jgi:hypothetical protein
MSRKLFLGIILLFLLFNNNITAQISGALEICRNQTIKYYYSVSGFAEGESVTWTVTGGTGYSNTPVIAVNWGANSSSLELRARARNYLGNYVTYTINPVYREVGVLDKIRIENNGETSFCSGDTINFVVDPEGTLQNNPNFFWTVFKNGSPIYTEIRSTNDLHYIVPEDVSDTEISVKVYAGITSCNIYTGYLISAPIQIKNCGFKLLGFNASQPLCKDYPAPEVEITGITDPTKSPFYSIELSPQKDSIDFTFTRFTRAIVLSNDDPECSNNGANGDAVSAVKIDGYDYWLCPSGYVANHTLKYAGESVILNPEDVVLKTRMITDTICDTIYIIKPGLPPRQIINCKPLYENKIVSQGLLAGVYSIQVENPLFCPFETFFEIDDPPLLEQGGNSAVVLGTYAGIDFMLSNPDSSDGEIQVQIKGGTPPWYVHTKKKTQSKIDYVSHLVGNKNDTTSSFYTFIVDNLPGDTLDVYVTDTNGCLVYENEIEKVNEIYLRIPDILKVDTTGINPVTCNVNDGGYQANGAMSIIINGGIGPYTVDCINLDSNIVKSIVVNDNKFAGLFDSLHYGNYKLRVRDKNQYQKDSIVKLIQQPPQPLAINQLELLPPQCSGGKTGRVLLTAVGDRSNYTFNFGGYSVFNDSLVSDTLMNGSYNAYLTDNNDCTTTANFDIPAPTNHVDFVFKDSIKVKCAGDTTGQIILSALGGQKPATGYKYYLFNNEPNPFNVEDAKISLQNDSIFSDLPAGHYYMYVEDDNNCLHTEISDKSAYQELITVIENNPITIDTLITPVAAKGDSTGKIGVTLDMGAGKFLCALVHNGDTSEIRQTANSILFDGLKSGIYTLMVKDTCGCTNIIGNKWWSHSIQIKEPLEALKLNYSKTDINCYGDTTGTISAAASGGWKKYKQYKITGPKNETNTDGIFENLPKGIYRVEVKDSMDVVVADTIIIDYVENSELKLESYTTTNVDCYEESNGEILLNLTGGKDYYQYSVNNDKNWMPGTNIIGLGVSAGLSENFTIYFRSDSTCSSKSAIITLMQPNEITVNFEKKTAQFGVNNGSIEAEVAGGIGPYTYKWTGGTSDSIYALYDSLYASNYNLIVIDDSLCIKKYENINLPGLPGPDLFNISTKKPTCNGWNDGFVSFVPVNGNPDYTIDLIQNGSVINSLASLDSASTYLFTGLYAGDYGLQITDDWGWKNIVPVSFSLDSVSLLSLDHSVTHITKYGDTDGKIIFDISGGNGFYEYILYNSSDSVIRSGETVGLDSIINLSKGFYSFYYKDTCGCANDNDLGSWIIVDSIGVIEPEPLRFTIDSIKQPTCFGDDDGYILVHGTGGWSQSEGYSYRKNKIGWQANRDFGNLLAGKYYIEVKDEKNVIYGDTVEVTQPDSLELSSVKINDVLCFGNSTGSIELSIAGGTLPYLINDNTYNYNNIIISDLSAGNYTFNIKDIRGCSIDTYIDSISEPTELTDSIIYIEAQDTLSNGSMFVLVEGSVEPYNIAWLNAAYDTISNTDSITNIPTGDYFISITDNNGCNLFDTLFLPQLGGPETANIRKTEITCNSYSNGVLEFELVDGHPPYDVRFINQENDTIQSFIGVYDSIPFEISGIKPGSYTFSIVDSWNWKAKEFYAFIEPQQITVTKKITDVLICGDSSGKVDFIVQGGNPNFEFVFKDVLTNIIILSGYSNGQISITGLRAGQYSLFLKDNKQCTNGHGDWLVVDDIVISQPLPLGLELIQLKSPKCFGDTNGCIEVIGKGGKMIGNNYQYRINDGSWSYFVLFNDLKAGQYIIEVKDQAGAIFKDTINLSQPELLELINLDISTNYCIESNLSSVNINMNGGTAPYYYLLNSIIWKKGTQINGLSYGEHTIYVKDTNNCRIAPQTIKIDKTEMLSVQFEKQSAQYGESNGWLKAIINGGLPAYNISWYNSSGNIISNQAELTDIPSGNYFIRISDQNGCEYSQSVILDAKYGPRLVSEPVSIAVSCFGKTDGEATFSIKDGNGNYHVDIIKGGELIQSFVDIPALESSKIQNLAAGNYTIQIKDSLQWYGEGSFIISSPEMIQIVTESIINPTCFGFNDASIDVNAVGGNGNYIFSWSNNGTGNTISNLSSGVYSVTVTDRLGCQGIKEFEINDPEKLVVDLGTDIQICLGQEYYLSTGLFASYSWSFEGIELADTRTIKVENQGEYQLIVKNENGCIASDKIVVEIRNDLLEAEFIMPSEAFVNDTVVIVDITWPAPENIYWTLAPGIVSVHSERYLEEITFTKPGIYDIMLTSRTAMCTDSIVKTILVIESEENKDETKMGSLINEFKVYPNPTSGEFTVEVSLSAISDLEVKIFNMQQNNYKLIEKYNSSDTYVLNYGFMNLGTGMYIVSIQAGSEQQSKRIMVIR